MRVIILGIFGLLSLGAVSAASAEDGYDGRERSYRARHHTARTHYRERLTPDQREFERARANNYDPTGSYSAYPDWARYALSPKGGGAR